MRVLVTGCAGQLGFDCVKRLRELRIDCLGVDRQEFDLTDEQAVTAFVSAYRPDAILHCAAYTAVDRAEDEPQAAAAVNGMGTLNMVRAAMAVDAKLLYVSTDYVFRGEGEAPYEADDPIEPGNVYGLSKAQGEQAVRQLMHRYFIVRTAWVFGLNGANFVRTMLRLGAERKELTVVNDQFGSPTYTRDLAVLLCDLIRTDEYGTYHATNEGFCSWADFADEIMRQSGLPCRIRPIPSSEYPTKARRPFNSRLSKASLDGAGMKRLPPWQDALHRYLEELRQAGVL